MHKKNIKWSNIHVIGILEVETDSGAQEIFEEIMGENFP